MSIAQQKLHGVFGPSVQLIPPPSDFRAPMTFPSVARRYLMTEPHESSPDDVKRHETTFMNIIASWLNDSGGVGSIIKDIDQELKSQGSHLNAARRFKWLYNVDEGNPFPLPEYKIRDELMFLVVSIYEKEYDLNLNPQTLVRRGDLPFIENIAKDEPAKPPKDRHIPAGMEHFFD